MARQDPQGVHWYEAAAPHGLCVPHMPFFLYLSGFIAASSGLLAKGRAGFCDTARARAKRLLLPFFGLGLLVLAGKLVAAKFVLSG